VSGDDDAELQRLRHDLRQPLVLIAGFAQLLASDVPIDDATRQEYARRIVAAGEELQQLLEPPGPPG
jgi:signal transduction histidine kinase